MGDKWDRKKNSWKHPTFTVRLSERSQKRRLDARDLRRLCSDGTITNVDGDGSDEVAMLSVVPQAGVQIGLLEAHLGKNLGEVEVELARRLYMPVQGSVEADRRRRARGNRRTLARNFRRCPGAFLVGGDSSE